MALINKGLNQDLTYTLFENFKEEHPNLRFSVCFPDAGALKRYGFALDSKMPYCVAHKTRDFKTGQIIDYTMNVYNDKDSFSYSQNNLLHDVVIIDDLCSKGGTFVHAAKKLAQLGTKNIYLIVAHCENNINNGEIGKMDIFKKVYTTDSILTEINDDLKNKIKILEM